MSSIPIKSNSVRKFQGKGEENTKHQNTFSRVGDGGKLFLLKC